MRLRSKNNRPQTLDLKPQSSKAMQTQVPAPMDSAAAESVLPGPHGCEGLQTHLSGILFGGTMVPIIE